MTAGTGVLFSRQNCSSELAGIADYSRLTPEMLGRQLRGNIPMATVVCR